MLLMLLSSLFLIQADSTTDKNEAVACLNALNQGYEYQWTSGLGPYKFDQKTEDHFIVLGDGFVRFGKSAPQRCDFSMVHNSTRDCVKIQDANGADIVVLKFAYPPENKKEACDSKNANSTTKFLYNNASKCKNLTDDELNKFLQKQIGRNTEKMIKENRMSRESFDKDYRKSCETIFNKLRKKYTNNSGDDYGAIVNYAAQEAAQSPAPTQEHQTQGTVRE